MESPELTLTVDQTAGDIRYYLLKAQKWTILLTALYEFLALFIVYVGASHYVEATPSQAFRVAAVMFLFGVPLLTVALNLLRVFRIAKAKADQLGPVILDFNESGVTLREENRTATFNWNAYQWAFEYKDKFVIVSKRGGLLVPKRCFESQEQMQSFRKLVETGLNGAIVNR